MTHPRLHPLLLELEQQKGVRATASNPEGALSQVGRRLAKGLCPPAPPLPAPYRRCHRKANATTAWTGESRDPGRRASDHPHRRAGDPGPARYLQPALRGVAVTAQSRLGASPPNERTVCSHSPQAQPRSSHRTTGALVGTGVLPAWRLVHGSHQERESEGTPWGRVSLRALPGEPRGPWGMGSPRKPGSSRLLTLSHLSVLAEGSLRPMGGAAFGKVGFSRLFNCRGACVPPPPPATMVRGCGAGRLLANPPRSGMCPPQGSLFGDLAQEKQGQRYLLLPAHV